MPLLSTNALPFAVSATFAGAICAKASELVQITTAAAMAANVLDIMTEFLLLGCSYASVSNNNSRNSNLFPQGSPFADKIPDERMYRRAAALISTSSDTSVRTAGAFLGKVMRRRLEAFIPIVLFSILVQLIAPIAAFRVVAYAVTDPLYMASICTGMASSDAQTAPAKTQHDHGDCCVFCAAGHSGSIAIDPPSPVFVSLQRLSQLISGLEAADPMPTVRVGSNAQARAPPQLT